MRAEELLPETLNHSDFGGVTVRKGTVGAFLINARAYLDAQTAPEQRAQAESHMAEALPALRALGLFDVFQAADPALQDFIARHTS